MLVVVAALVAIVLIKLHGCAEIKRIETPVYILLAEIYEGGYDDVGVKDLTNCWCGVAVIDGNCEIGVKRSF